jgi:putative nucleotidyltransferase with HDIG domain
VKRILFVDDETRVLHGFRASLYARRADWDMRFVDSGAEAIRVMEETHFDVLVTDLRMPGMDGATLVARARSDSPDTIRIVLSGHADEERSRRLVYLAHRYLSKPCLPRQLEECIGRCLATQSMIESTELRVQLGAVATLPPIPATFAALQQVLANAASDSNKVAAVIERDPAICAKVLQVCNSAFFRLPRRVVGIPQAVSYLGLSAVRSIVLSAELFHAGTCSCPGLDLARMQRHSLCVAALARSLAEHTAWADDAFLAGLLHDVGFLLPGRTSRDGMLAALAAAASGTPLVDAERAFVGVDHGTAGAYLLGLWGLPYEIVETVAHHEDCGPIIQSYFDVLGAVRIAHALLIAIRPADVPAFEMHAPVVGDQYLRAMGHPHTWDSLLVRADALLGAEAAA